MDEGDERWQWLLQMADVLASRARGHADGVSIATVPAIVVLLLLAAGLMTWNALLLSRANPDGPLRWSSLPPHRNRSYPLLYGLTLVSGMAGMLELRHRVGTWPAVVTVMAVLLLPAFVVMRLHNQRVRSV